MHPQSASNKPLGKLIAALFAALAPHPAYPLFGQVNTPPQGYVTLNVAAGTGTASSVTILSAPLLDTAKGDGRMSGVITATTADTFFNSSAGWTPGQLSNVATPNLVRITSGIAEGRTFQVSTQTRNTSTGITISSLDASQTNLNTLGIVVGTDTYQIIPCDTISTLFGTPQTTGILGGTHAAGADNVYLNANGIWVPHFYHTGLGRWVRGSLGSPDATNTPIVPDRAIMYTRLASSPLSFVLFGRVPMENRKALVANAGITFLSNAWTVDRTLTQSNLQNLPGWVSGATASVADTVYIFDAGFWKTFWYDGVNWRRQSLGSPISNNQLLQSGSGMMISKTGTAAGAAVLAQNRPY